MLELNEIIKSKLLANKLLISSACRNFKDMLGYSVILKEYSIENIGKLAMLEMECQEMDGASKYEINFELLDSKLFTIDDVYCYERII